MRHVFDPLPLEGKMQERCKRIITLCIAPFRYLLLGMRALGGLFLEPCYYRRHLSDDRSKTLISLLELEKQKHSKATVE